jgi:hypothetical protein
MYVCIFALRELFSEARGLAPSPPYHFIFHGKKYRYIPIDLTSHLWPLEAKLEAANSVSHRRKTLIKEFTK